MNVSFPQTLFSYFLLNCYFYKRKFIASMRFVITIDKVALHVACQSYTAHKCTCVYVSKSVTHALSVLPSEHRISLTRHALRYHIVGTTNLYAIHSFNNTKAAVQLGTKRATYIYHLMSMYKKAKMTYFSYRNFEFKVYYLQNAKRLLCHSYACISFHCVMKIRPNTFLHQENVILSVLINVKQNGHWPSSC